MGPITDAALEPARPGCGQAKIEAEWMDSLERDGDFLFFWGGAFKARWQVGDRTRAFGITWHSLTFSESADPADAIIRTPPTNVALVLSSLAHESRVQLLQELFSGPKSAAEMTDLTGLKGGNLYHHLRELLFAHYVEQDGKRYRLTQRGAQMLITVACLARRIVRDVGEAGLVVSGWETTEDETP